MRESVLNQIVKCPKCGTSYMPRAGETCNCPEPMFPEKREQRPEHNRRKADPK
jgi:uncharacterized OB-fold protein